MRGLCVGVGLFLFASPWLRAADPIIVFRNATIYPGAAEPIPDATLIVQGDKILSVSATADTPKFPANATIVDLAGAVIIPGLVDTHSHIGIYPKPAVPAHSDGNEMSGPVQAIGRALDAVDPNDPGIKMALAGGVTTANIMPGSGNVIGGQTLYVKLIGTTVEAMLIQGRAADGTAVVGGLKMANGENPKGYGRRNQAPFTRMKIAALQREQFAKAKEYLAKLNSDKKPDRDLALEPLVEVLQKKRTVHFHCHRADDLMTAVRIAEEFGFELVLQHATEAYRVAPELAKRKIPVSLTLVDSPGGKAEVMGLIEENAAILEKAGVPVSINTDDFITESRFYLKTGAIALRGGMSEVSALKALTATAATIMHLDHRLGQLAKGLDADFVILSGKPFSVYTKVQETWINGKKVFDAAKESDRAYRDGGSWLPAGTQTPTLPVVKPLAAVKAPEKKANPLAKPGKSTVILAGRIHTASGPPILNGVILIEDGLIKKIGERGAFGVPNNAEVLTAAEVTPGLIDPHSVVGLSGAWNIPADQDQDETSDPNQADLRVIDGFNPNEPLLEFLRANGITTVHATPGRATILAGTSAIVRTSGGTIEKCVVNPAAAFVVNLGEIPKETFKEKGPKTRMGIAALVRRQFAEAQAYAAKEPKERNAKLEALKPVLAKKIPVAFTAHRADDLLTALRIAEEFQLDARLVLGTDAYLVADTIAAKKVPIVLHPTTQRPGDQMETRHSYLGSAFALKAKGIPLTICTSYEGYVPKQRNLRLEAAVAAANGLGPTVALQTVTIDSAKLLGISDKYGSLEVGKVADLVLYDGDPFEHATHVSVTIMNGKVVYDRAEYLKLPFERRILPIVGGAGVGCCLGVW